jgi:hypothetical protein
VYYALKRNADFSPDGPKGEKTHISYALRIEAVPAYVLTPEANQVAATVQSYKSMASPDTAVKRSTSFYVIDGIVIDRNAKTQAGPNAVILPPTSPTGASL